MEQVLKILHRHIKLSTALQVGLDSNISKIICDYFLDTTFVDVNCDWSWKNIPDHEDCTCNLFSSEEEYLNEIEYTNPYYDFGYIYSRNSKDFQRSVLTYMIKKKFKVILIHPTVFCFDPPFYKKISILTEEGEYKLYYQDFIHQDFEDYFKDSKI